MLDSYLIKSNSSESQSRKVETMHMHSKNMTTVIIFTHNEAWFCYYYVN